MEGTPFGRYRLIRLMGRGGMGEVWRAHDTATDRVVAIKLLPANFSENAEFQERFRREAHAAARLNSPHVIPIHDYGEIDGRLYVSMRLIEGRDLQTVLGAGPLDPARAVRIIQGIAKALHAAHKVDLVHRDVKPSNILLDEDDFAYLIDFGIARAAADTRLTSTGNMIGTFQYMAPERFGRRQEDARADIYALACVLYECLIGQPPFAEDSAEHLMVAHLTTPPPQPSSSDPSIPPQIDKVIATGMAKEPDQRYATAIELADAARDSITVPIKRLTAGPSRGPEPAQLSPSADQRVATARQQTDWTTQPPTQLAPTAPIRPPAPSNEIRGRRLSRRSKIVAAAVAVVVLAVAAVVVVVLDNNTSNADPARRLAAAVSSSGCNQTTAPTYSPAGADLTTECGEPNPVIIHLIYAVFRDRTAFNTEATQTLNPRGDVNGTVVQPCPGMSQSPQEWHRAGQPQPAGRVVCYTWEGNGMTFPQVDWTIDSELVIGYAQGSSGKTMDEVYQWWAAHYQ